MAGIKKILSRPFFWAMSRFASRPDKARIDEALTKLADCIREQPGKKGLLIPFDVDTGKFIIFSDQHKGKRNGADDFAFSEANYLAAMEYYFERDYQYISLGDSEELWENSIWKVKKWNKAVFDFEKKFLQKKRFYKVFGNHDLFWNTSPWAYWHLKSIYGEAIKVYEGLILETHIQSSGKPDDKDFIPLSVFLTHGHQGDAQSDGNWFSRVFVQYVWAPFQSLFRINPNTPAYNSEKKTLHNSIMYEWSSRQKNIALVTGHTHQPVFQSLTILERLYKQFQLAEKNNDAGQLTSLLNEIKTRENEFAAVALDYMTMKPSYFNSGCCCYNDGDITGIEISHGHIRLIKWNKVSGQPTRVVLEKISIAELAHQLNIF